MSPPANSSPATWNQAINIPLDEIEAGAPKRLKDKNQTLLLHCASGMRSGMAQRKLTGLGYTNVFNLGSSRWPCAEDCRRRINAQADDALQR